MKRFFSSTLIAFLISFLYSSCDTDFEINAEWQDVTIVYGLLDQEDAVHYIKVNKAYLGAGDAYDMAQIADSSEYDGLTGTIYEFLLDPNGNKLLTANQEWPLEEFTVTNKETGTFYAPNQKMYRFTATLDKDAIYDLELNVPAGKDGSKVVTSSTSLIQMTASLEDNLWVKNDNRMLIMNNPASGGGGLKLGESGQAIVFKAPENAKRLHLQAVFSYEEYLHSDTLNPDSLAVTIDLGNYVVGPNIEVFDPEITRASFFGAIENAVPAAGDDIMRRMVLEIHFILSIASDDLHTFLQVNEPADGIVQEKKQYTNIVNGFGIFASRYKSVFEVEVSQSVVKMLADGDPSIDEYYLPNKMFCGKDADMGNNNPVSCSAAKYN